MTFPDGRKAALSYTFDDGMSEHAKIAAPLLAQYGFRGTFFIIPGLTEEHEAAVTLPSQYHPGKRLPRQIAGWQDWREVVAMGHEIGNHSWSHSLLWKLRSKYELNQEIVGAKEEIEKRLATTVESWAWPYYRPHRDHEKMARAHHSFVRSMEFQLSFSHTMVQERANRWIDKAIDQGRHFIIVIHGIGKGIDHVELDLLEQNIRYARCRKKDIWVAPMKEVAQHLAEGTRC